MDVLHAKQTATAGEIQEALPDAPSYSAVRTLLRILEEKGHIRHRSEGARYVYLPKVSKQTAGKSHGGAGGRKRARGTARSRAPHAGGRRVPYADGRARVRGLERGAARNPARMLAMPRRVAATGLHLRAGLRGPTFRTGAGAKL